MLDKSCGLWYNGNSARYYPARRAARFVPTCFDGNAKSRLEINSNRLLVFRKETKNNDLKLVACQVGIEPTLSRLTAACFTC